MQGLPAGSFPWPLLLLQQQAAWAVLRVSVPSSPIRASPLSDVWLPCNISDSTRSINLGDLGVTWRRGKQDVARYPDGFNAVRQGARMSEEQLQRGDASLLLPRVEDTDSGVYICDVIHTPEKEEGIIELKVEAEPRIELGSTKLHLAKPGTLDCTVSDFYPGNITVEWLKDGVVVKGRQTSISLDARSGLYKARNTLELIPGIADANANFSCRVTHKSLQEPLKENFQLQLQALPVLQVFPVVSAKTLEVLDCLVSGFYPQDIQVRWLRNGVRQLQMESQPQVMPNGTFSMHSVIRPQELDLGVQYVCQVQHKAWDAPLELTANWQPKAEDITALWSWIVLGFGLVLNIIGGIMLYRAFKKDKNKPCPATKTNFLGTRRDPEETGRMLEPEKECSPDSTTTPM